MASTRRACVEFFVGVFLLSAATCAAAEPTDADLAAFRTHYQAWKSSLSADQPLEAVASAEKSRDEILRLYGDKHAFTARVLVELGALQSQLGRYRVAEATLKQGLSIAAATGIDAGEIHEELGAYYELVREFPKSESHFVEAKRWYEKRTTEKEVALARVQSRLALTLMGRGRLDEAKQSAERAVAALVALRGEGDLETVQAGIRLAVVQIAAGDFVEVERNMTAVLDLLAIKHPENRTLQADAMMELGNSRQRLGGLTPAEELFIRCRDLRSTALGPEHPHVAFAINNLGSVAKELGKLNDAKQLFKASLQLKEKAYGRRSVEVVKTLQNLGIIADLQLQYKEAEQMYDECTSIARERLEIDSAIEGSLLWNLFVLKVRTSRIEPGLVDGRRALQIMERQQGPNHPGTVALRGSLLHIYGLLGRAADAEQMFLESINGLTSRLGPDDPSAATLRVAFAEMLFNRGKLDEAERQAQISLAAFEKNSLEGHPDAARAFTITARSAMLRDDHAAAVHAMDRCRRIMRRVTGDLMPTLSEGERLRILREYDAASYPVAVSLGMSPGVSRHAEHAAIAAGWVLNGKGIAAEASLRQRDPGGDREASPAAKVAVARLREVRTALMKAALPSADGKGPTADEVRRLSAEEESLRRQLANEAGVRAIESRWVELNEIAEQIPPGGVLVEFVRTPLHTFDPTTKKATVSPETHYVAWIIYPKSEGLPPKFIPLGPANVIDKQAAFIAFQSGTMAPQFITRFGENRAEFALRGPLHDFTIQTLGRVLTLIRDRKHWIISPDAELWLVPWSALVLTDGRYVIQDHTVTLVTSGRDLVSPRTPASTQPAVILADPNYGGEQDENERPFRDLPGSRVEADAVAPLLKSYTKQDARVLLRDEATEENLAAISRPSVLHLSTHGFYLPLDPQLPIQPLARTGLALAGANGLGLRKTTNDGILTGLEAADLDLQGTKLVVLSACETGIGRIVSGEGVDGLRKAFHRAGAETVLSTLWSIPDQETATLVTEFFRRYTSNVSPATALRDAQLAAIVERRKKHGGAHPLFWAAFVTTSSVPPTEPITPSPEMPAIQAVQLAGARVEPADGGWNLHQTATYSIWQPDGRLVLVARGEGYSVFNPATQKLENIGGEVSPRMLHSTVGGSWLTCDFSADRGVSHYQLLSESVGSKKIEMPSRDITGLDYAADGKTAVVLDATGRLHVVDVVNGKVTKTLQTTIESKNNQRGAYHRVSLSADGSTLVTLLGDLNKDQSFVVIDVAADKEKARFHLGGKLGNETSHGFELTPDGRQLVVLSRLKSYAPDPVTGKYPPTTKVRLLDATTGQPLRQYLVPEGATTAGRPGRISQLSLSDLKLSADGKFFLVSAGDSQQTDEMDVVLRYRLDQPQPTSLARGEGKSSVGAVSISADGKWAAFSLRRGSTLIRVLPLPSFSDFVRPTTPDASVATAAPVSALPIPAAQASATKPAPSGGFAVPGGTPNIATPPVPRPSAGPPAPNVAPQTPAPSPIAKTAESGTPNSVAAPAAEGLVQKIRAGWVIAVPAVHTIWQPDGRVVVFGDAAEAYLFDPARQSLQVLKLPHAPEFVRSAGGSGAWLSWNRNSELLRLSLNDAVPPALQSESIPTSMPIADLIDAACTADGKKCALLDREDRMKLIELATGREYRSVRHSAPGSGTPPEHRQLTFSPDGAKLAFIGNSGMTRVMESDAGGRTLLGFGNTAKPKLVAFTADSQAVLASSASGIDRRKLELGARGEAIFPTRNAAGLAVSPDGRHVLISTEPTAGGAHVQLRRLDDRQSTVPISQINGMPVDMKFSADGKLASFALGPRGPVYFLAVPPTP